MSRKKACSAHLKYEDIILLFRHIASIPGTKLSTRHHQNLESICMLSTRPDMICQGLGIDSSGPNSV